MKKTLKTTKLHLATTSIRVLADHDTQRAGGACPIYTDTEHYGRCTFTQDAGGCVSGHSDANSCWGC